MDRDDAERIINELFTSSYSATVRYAAYRCGSLDLAEDLVQEAFGALYVRLREGIVIKEPRAWVMKDSPESDLQGLEEESTPTGASRATART